MTKFDTIIDEPAFGVLAHDIYENMTEGMIMAVNTATLLLLLKEITALRADVAKLVRDAYEPARG